MEIRCFEVGALIHLRCVYNTTNACEWHIKLEDVFHFPQLSVDINANPLEGAVSVIINISHSFNKIHLYVKCCLFFLDICMEMI